jgi:hypothetical protein
MQSGGVQRMAVFQLGEPEEKRRSEGEGPNGFGLARPQKRAKCSASGRLGSFLQARAYASNKPRTSKLEADGVEADRERQPCEWLCKYAGSARTGAVRSTKVSSWANRGVRSTRLWHRMCVERGSLTRERENPRVRVEVDITNPFGSIVSSHDPRHSTVLAPRGSLHRYHHESSRRLPLRPFSTHCNPRQASSSTTESRHRRAFLFADPVATRLHFPRVLLHNQGYPKVCPDPLNLSNAGDSFAGISSLTSCYLFSWTKDLITSF